MGFTIVAILLGLVATGKAQTMHLYIGTYTGPESKGIYRATLDLDTGVLSATELAAETRNPSFLALHPTRPLLFAASEIGDFDGKKSGAVAAFEIDPVTRNLRLLNQQATGGGGTCHVSVSPDGKVVFAANYGGGSVASFKISDDGSIAPASSKVQHEGTGPNRKRQDAPHAHSISPSPDGRFALACDLGTDQVLIYSVDADSGAIVPHDPPFVPAAPGAGPRHLAVHPNGKAVYVINELNNTIAVYAWDGTLGRLTEVQSTSTLPDTFKGESTTAEVAVHPSGRFVYGSNRGHDSIAIFSVDEETGRLRAAGFAPTQGVGPRHFAIDPTGQFLIAANSKSHTLVAFRIDLRTGQLTPTGSTATVHSPVCVRFAGAE